MIFEILEYLSLKDLTSWRATRHYARVCGNEVLSARMRHIVRPFTKNVDGWIDTMRAFNIFCIGNHALALLHGESKLSRKDSLDLLVPGEFFDKFTTHLVDVEGYTRVIRNMDGPRFHPTYLKAGFAWTSHFEKNDHLIQAIVIRDAPIFKALPYCWSTLLMNAFSPDHIYSFYPVLTLRRRGYILQQFLDDDIGDQDGVISADLQHNYAALGFSNSLELMVADRGEAEGHDVVPYYARPIFPRALYDSHTMHIVITDDPLAVDNGFGAKAVNKTVIWRLGGMDKIEASRVHFHCAFRCRAVNRSSPLL